MPLHKLENENRVELDAIEQKIAVVRPQLDRLIELLGLATVLTEEIRQQAQVLSAAIFDNQPFTMTKSTLEAIEQIIDSQSEEEMVEPKDLIESLNSSGDLLQDATLDLHHTVNSAEFLPSLLPFYEANKLHASFIPCLLVTAAGFAPTVDFADGVRCAVDYTYAPQTTIRIQYYNPKIATLVDAILANIKARFISSVPQRPQELTAMYSALTGENYIELVVSARVVKQMIDDLNNHPGLKNKTMESVTYQKLSRAAAIKQQQEPGSHQSLRRIGKMLGLV